MKKFNKVINIEVSVDAIAQQLLNMMKEDANYREQTAEHIVGVMMERGRLGFLYNAINGTIPTLLPVGTTVFFRDYTYEPDDPSAPPDLASYKQVKKTLSGVISSVDEYSTTPYNVDYNVVDSKGKTKGVCNRYSADDLATTADEL